MHIYPLTLALLIISTFTLPCPANEELDSYWKTVSAAVGSGDFDTYAATCHPKGVLVSGKKQTSQPLSKALEKWKAEFDDTKAGKMKASVTFRFSQRLHDDATAHETGMFLYSSTDSDGKETKTYIHFEALLLKTKSGWKIMMEYQKSEGTQEQWDALAKP